MLNGGRDFPLNRSSSRILKKKEKKKADWCSQEASFKKLGLSKRVLSSCYPLSRIEEEERKKGVVVPPLHYKWILWMRGKKNKGTSYVEKVLRETSTDRS